MVSWKEAPHYINREGDSSNIGDVKEREKDKQLQW